MTKKSHSPAAKSGPTTEATASDTPEKSTRDAVVSEIKFFLGMFAFILVFHTFIFGHYKIPSESMQPTLEVGDHLYVSKFAYGYSKHSLPFGIHKLPVWPEGKMFSRLPERGDVVVFRNPHNGVVMIKRALGLPGDKITVRNGRYYLNDDLIPRTPFDQYVYQVDNGPRGFVNTLRGQKKGHERWGQHLLVVEYDEQWPTQDKPHRIYEETDKKHSDNAGTFVVPAGTIFMLGDNRDRSHDSRVDNSRISRPQDKGPGFVPLDHLIGRADMMMFSFKKCSKEEGVRCPPRRFMKRL